MNPVILLIATFAIGAVLIIGIVLYARHTRRTETQALNVVAAQQEKPGQATPRARRPDGRLLPHRSVSHRPPRSTSTHLSSPKSEETPALIS